MKRSVFIHLLALFFIPDIESQNVQWSAHKTFSTSASMFGRHAWCDKSQCSYVLSVIDLTGSLLVKYDPQGNLLWETMIPLGFDSRITGNGSRIFVSYSDTAGYHVNKYDYNGSLQQKVNIIPDALNKINGIAADSLGNFYVTGIYVDYLYIGSYTFQPTSYNWPVRMYVAKFDSLNTCLWARNSGVDGNNAQVITLDAAGNIFVGGFYYNWFSFGSIAVTQTLTNRNGFVIKLDNSGNESWIADCPASTNGNGGIQFLSCDPVGNLYALGRFYDQISVAGFTLDPSLSHLMLLKIDHNGAIQWARQLGGGGIYGDEPGGVSAISGNVFVGGEFHHAAQIGNLTLQSLNTNTNQNLPEPFVAKFDPAGNVQWAKNMGCSASTDAGIGSISSDAQENVFVTGYMNGYLDFDNHPQQCNSYGYYLAKVEKDIQVGIDREKNDQGLSIIPNPSSGLVVLNYKINSLEAVNITVRDIAGKVVLTHEIDNPDTNEIQLSLSHLDAGIYLVTLKEGKTLIQKKLLIVD